MADIELVIKIPEEEYNLILKSDDSVFADCASKECMMHSIKNGTPLDKIRAEIMSKDGLEEALEIIDKYRAKSEVKCKNCEYYRNPDYTRCHKCKAESEGKE